MKRLCVIFICLLFVGVMFAADRPVEGKKFELGTALSFYSFKQSGSTYDITYLYVPVRFGWFVWKGLEIEPEINFQIPFGDLASDDYYDMDVSYIFSLNAFYNFKLDNSKWIPFVGGGVGFGNAFPYYYYAPLYGDKDTTTTAWNFGGGVKYLLASQIALRIEYRYNHYHWKWEDDGAYNFRIHQFNVGFSFFF